MDVMCSCVSIHKSYYGKLENYDNSKMCQINHLSLLYYYYLVI